MTRFFFHVDDGSLTPDAGGTEFANIDAARSEAVSLAGAMLKELDGEFWDQGEPWTLHVTDEAGLLLFSLHFSAEVPSGKIRFEPEQAEIAQARSLDRDGTQMDGRSR